MCGQAGIHRRNGKPVPRLGALANELLLQIETRGRHATGLLAVHDSGKVQLCKRTQPARKFVRSRPKFADETRTVLLHTRWATVGRKEDPKNAHPVGQGTVAATHNGTISNADEIFAAFSLPREAEVDSEVIPALINHAGWDQAEQSLSLLDGGAAVAVVSTEHPDEVLLARLRYFPLCYATATNAIVWASTEEAIRAAWYRAYGRPLRAKVHHLAEGELVRIKNGKAKKLKIPGWKPERKIARKPKQRFAQPDPKPKRRRTLAPGAPDSFARTDDAVAVLMKCGWDRAEAEAEVYGTWDDVEWSDVIDTSGMSPAQLAWMELA